jgi:phosphonate transport system ATP-binding protein
MGLFDLREASAHYNGSAVLRDITFTIEAGDKVALVGKSGAGKSTLLNLLYQQRQQETTIVPQALGLVKTLSVFHNIYMGRLQRNALWYNLRTLVRPARDEVESVRSVAMKLGIEEKLFEPTGELSGGQQQRTAVARALYCGGDAVLGDEPVSAVDGRQAGIVLDALFGAFDTVVLAMHDVDLALAYADRIIGMRDGRIVLDRPTAGTRHSDLDSIYES